MERRCHGRWTPPLRPPSSRNGCQRRPTASRGHKHLVEYMAPRPSPAVVGVRRSPSAGKYAGASRISDRRNSAPTRLALWSAIRRIHPDSPPALQRSDSATRVLPEGRSIRQRSQQRKRNSRLRCKHTAGNECRGTLAQTSADTRTVRTLKCWCQRSTILHHSRSRTRSALRRAVVRYGIPSRRQKTQW